MALRLSGRGQSLRHVAPRAGADLGRGFGSLVRRSAMSGVAQDVQQLNTRAQEMDPQTYAGELLGVLSRYGMQPGPIFNQLTSLHTGWWQNQQAQQERKGEIQAALEEKRRQEAEKAAQQQREDEAGLSRRMTGARISREAGVPDYAWKGVLTGNLDAKTAIGMRPEEEEPKNPWQYDLARGVRVNTETAEVEPLVGMPKPPEEPKDLSKVEKDLRGEFRDLSKDFMKVRDAYGRIIASADNPSAAGDLALVFNYMKVLDPGSVVRESEFATAQNAAGVPERIRNLYNRVLSGERLGDEQRMDFVSRAQRLFGAARAQHSQRENEFRRLAGIYEANPEAIILDYGLSTEKPTTPGTEGEVRNGWRFQEIEPGIFDWVQE